MCHQFYCGKTPLHIAVRIHQVKYLSEYSTEPYDG